MPRTLLPSKIIGEIVKEYAVDNGIRYLTIQFLQCIVPYKIYVFLAATIDNSVHEKDILFIQAAGNLKCDNSNTFRLGITQHLLQGRNYPDYLLENSCRIPNPAQSMQALTVGALCVNGYEDDDWISFGERGAISSYSCSGLGLWGQLSQKLLSIAETL